MSTSQASNENHEAGEAYLILLKGQLDNRWVHWFDGFRIRYENDGTTVLYGLVADQSQLHGLLRKVRDLGIPLLLVAQSNLSSEIIRRLQAET